jgi:hypothetical protein
MKLKEEVKRKQGLAALALVNFAEEYEIEGIRRLEVGAGLGWDPLGGMCEITRWMGSVGYGYVEDVDVGPEHGTRRATWLCGGCV